MLPNAIDGNSHCLASVLKTGNTLLSSDKIKLLSSGNLGKNPPLGGGGGRFLYKRAGVPVAPLRVKNAVLVTLMRFSLKRSTAGGFAVLFRVLSLVHPLGDLFKIPVKHPHLLHGTPTGATEPPSVAKESAHPCPACTLLAPLLLLVSRLSAVFSTEERTCRLLFPLSILSTSGFSTIISECTSGRSNQS